MYKKIMLYIISIFSAVYLTFIINEITLETNLQRFFVFSYFFVLLCGILCFLRQYICAIFFRCKILVPIMIIITTIAFACRGNQILPHYYGENYLTITILNQRNINSKGNEVWIKSIKLDGASQKIENYADEQKGWKMNNDSLVGTLDVSKPLVLMLPSAKNITIILGTHMWSGQIEISDTISTNIYDLYSENGGEIKLVLDGNRELYKGMFGKLLKISSVSFLIMLEMILGALYEIKIEKNMSRKIR